MRARRTGEIALALAVVLVATLTPTGGLPSSAPGPLCVFCGVRGSADLLSNILLFVPLGAALQRRGRSFRATILIAVALSAGIEIAQLVIPARSPSLRDVITNGLGALLGAFAAARAPAWLTPGPRSTWRLVASVAIVAAAPVATGWAWQPMQTDAAYFGQWAPQLGHLETWSGRVLAASIDSVAVPDGPLATTDRVRRLLAEGAPVRVTALAGVERRGLAPIFAVADADERHVLMLGQDGPDLILRLHRRANQLRFDAPDIVFAGLLTGMPAGAPLTIDLTGSPARRCARVRGEWSCAEPPAAGSLWNLLVSDPRWTAANRRALDALTLFLLALPFGALRLHASRLPRSLAPIALAGALIVSTAAGGLALPSPVEWLALVAAIFAGRWVDTFLRA